MTAYGNLFQPVRIGKMIVKNRLLMSAMSINFGVDEKGCITEQLIHYMAARARGGVGMMLVGGGGVHPSGVELPDLPALWKDECLTGLRNMVAAVKPYGCRLGMQIMHGGRQSYHDNRVAPSAIAAPALVHGVPRALEREEIAMLVAAFGDAARRCKDAGFDFIEIHGAHGYLINQFLSPNANTRTDRYGGSFENRIRFFIEVLENIKAKCGGDFPVGARMNGEDYIRDGWTLPQALKLAPILEEKGADYLHVSAGVYGGKQLTIPSMYAPQGCFAHLAQAIKKKVRVPVVAVGRIKSPQMANDLIARQCADVIALGRSLLADPNWPDKARTGLIDQIRPCIGCCLGCIHAVFQLEPGGCVVNPDVGREFVLPRVEQKTAHPKNLLIVGAGPAGLAAARMAALHGHRVTLCDQQVAVGGALRLAARMPGRAELGDILAFFEKELERLGVDIFLETPLDGFLLARTRPDEVVLATGSLPQMPMLKGLYKTRMQLCTVTELLMEEVAVGARIIVLGGDQVGLVISDHLAQNNAVIAVLHRGRHFAREMSSNDRYYLRERLKAGTVTLYKDVVVDTFLENGVRFRTGGRHEALTGYDTLVLADTFAPLREGANMLRRHNVMFGFIGDAKQPRHLMYAISEGEEWARALSWQIEKSLRPRSAPGIFGIWKAHG